MGKGGGGSPPEVTSNPRFAGNESLYTNEQQVANLTNFEQEQFNPLVSDANWAMDIATGGNYTPMTFDTSTSNPYGTFNGDHAPNQAPFGQATGTYNPYTGGGSGNVAEVAGAQGVAGVESATPGSGSAAMNTQAPLYGGGGENSLLGPYLSAQSNALSAAGSVAQQGIAGQGGVAGETNAPGTNLQADGLYADQEAMIDAQTQAAQASVTQQLAGEGLSSSTQGAELGGELQQQGAAAKGGLIQGNIGLAQAGVGLEQSATQIQQTAQTDEFGMFSSIASMDSQQQAQMWNEAMQGQGALGNMLTSVLGTYGMDNQDIQITNQASLGNAQDMKQSGGGKKGGGGGGGSAAGAIGAIGGLFASSAGGTSAAAGIGTALAGLFS